MIQQFSNKQTNALFRMIHNESVFDRDFYGKDKEEKLLTMKERLRY
ncbi:hypothetical protein [Pedobacter sp. MR22-3]|nr:hypothetical protein [Pedobacter sp. MR22-3]MCX2583952.1 hypothetical protein [Pedobacter sp. MR22-3]